jgi:hypothetical protein
MKPDRPGTTVVLIDIKYHKPLNSFEEFYGNNITYHELEQESYVEFKDSMFINISKDIKFRKYGRIGPVLTIKADMLELEIEQFKNMLEREGVKLLHNWIVTNVTIIRDKDKKEENDKRK